MLIVKHSLFYTILEIVPRIFLAYLVVTKVGNDVTAVHIYILNGGRWRSQSVFYVSSVTLVFSQYLLCVWLSET